MSLFRNALYLVQFGVVKMTLQALLKTDCVDLKQLEFEEQRRAVRSHRKQEPCFMVHFALLTYRFH